MVLLAKLNGNYLNYKFIFGNTRNIKVVVKDKIKSKVWSWITYNPTNIPRGTLVKKSRKYVSKNIRCNILVVE